MSYTLIHDESKRVFPSIARAVLGPIPAVSPIFSSRGLDQRRLCAGSWTWCRWPLLSVDPEGSRENAECGPLPRAVPLVERSHRELAASPGHSAANATFIPACPLQHSASPTSPQAPGQESFRANLSAIRVSPN